MNNLVAQQNVLGDIDALDRITNFASLMASARISIPAELQKNPGDCLALCLQAHAWGMNPFAVAQKSHVIKGRLGYEAQLINAVIVRHAPIEHRPVFTWSEGWDRIIGKFKKVPGKHGGAEYAVPNWADKDEDGLWCEVSATIKKETAPRVLRLEMKQAQPRQSTLWATDPKQQLAYTVMKRWARLHCPDVILGIYTPEELKAIPDSEEKDVTPSDKLKAALQGEKVTVRTETGQPAAGSTGQPPARSTLGQYIDYKQESSQDVVMNDQAEAMKQRVRENLRETGQVVDVEPTEEDKVNLEMALQCLQSSKTLEQLDEAAQAIKDVLHADHREQARKVYRGMVRELS